MNYREINDWSGRFNLTPEQADRIASTVSNEQAFIEAWENETWWLADRFTLSDRAFATLLQFCVDNLKPGLDPMLYADGLVSEHSEWSGNVVFEIDARHSVRRHAMTISFDQADDFDCNLMDGRMG